MDVSLIKKRLEQLQSKGKGGSKKDDKLFFKPQLGKQVIRIVPSKFSKDYPFKEVFVHQFEIFKKTIPSLKSWGKKDPVEEFVKSLFESSDQGDWALAKKLGSKRRVFVNVIVRGEEEKGVRLWEFGKETYEKLLTIMGQDDEYGDITDLVEGTDLTVEGYQEELKFGGDSGKKAVKYIAVNITPKRNITPLSEDDEEIKSWIKDQVDPLSLYTPLSFAEIKDLLKKYLSPEDVEEEEVEAEEAEDIVDPDLDADAHDQKTAKKKVAVKQVIKKKPVVEEETEDDLPFEPDAEETPEEDEEDEESVVVKKKPVTKPTVVAKKPISTLKASTTKTTPKATNKAKFDNLFDN